MINFTPNRTHIPKQCWDYLSEKWVDCDEIVLRNRNFKGKYSGCCIDSARCCFTCDDLETFSTLLYNVNIATSLPYFSPVPPAPPVPDAATLIFAFNLVNTAWEIIEGVGIRDVENDVLYECYPTFTYETEFPTSPTKYCFIMQSNVQGCPDLRFCTYIYEQPVPGAANYYTTRILKPTICLDENFEDITYDDVDDSIHCNKCSSLIPRNCFFQRDVTENLPGTIYWGESYNYQFDLIVDECCDDTEYVVIYISPNPYITLTPNPTYVPISVGVNSISLTIDVNAGSGSESLSAFVFVNGSCADISIPLKSFIDEL